MRKWLTAALKRVERVIAFLTATPEVEKSPPIIRLELTPISHDTQLGKIMMGRETKARLLQVRKTQALHIWLLTRTPIHTDILSILMTKLLHMYKGLIQLTVTGADASCIYLESLSFSLSSHCIFLVYTHGSPHTVTQAPSRDEITTNRNIRRQINFVRRTVAATQKSIALAIISTDRVSRSSTKANAQVNVSERIHNALASTAVNDDPRIYDEAMPGPLKHHWEAAILEEANSIQRNETFTTVDDPHHNCNDPTPTKPIDSKLVFKTKRNPDGSTHYKGRLVP